MLYVVCFSLGLGPIPFMYAAECFRQNERSTGVALCVLVNWLSTFAVALLFPFFAQSLDQYVFLVFSGIMIVILAILIPKMVETKNRSAEEIIQLYNK
jgi:magnesium-transporting ATPase (P-type)